jgi:hypothetical protein
MANAPLAVAQHDCARILLLFLSPTENVRYPTLCNRYQALWTIEHKIG